MRSFLGAASLLAFVSFATAAGGQEPKGASESDVAETGRKLSNPLSDVWALFSRFDLNFADGDVNSGGSKVGGAMLFQPIRRTALRRRGQPVESPHATTLRCSSATVSDGPEHLTVGGLGDFQLPSVIAPPTGNWILGAGPAFLFPTATDDAFGRQQWGLGPALVVGYRTEGATFGVFGQYYFGIGSTGGREPGLPDASFLNLLYFLSVNLANAWQFGFSPTITYDARATPGNRWNVPVGLLVNKTTLLGKMPVKFSFGLEYSVVSQDVYGDRAKLVLEVIPVIPSLIRRSILGGN